MNWTKYILSSEILSTLGWTLVHSIWIGGIVFIIAWMLLYFFRNSKANYRYIIATGSLVAYLSTVTYTFFNINASQSIQFSFNLNISENIQTISSVILEKSRLNNLINGFSFSSIENYINDNIPVLVVIWLVGLTFFCFRFMGGLFYTYRLRSKSKEIWNGEISTTIRNISQKIGLKSKIQLKESAFISTPMVIGFIKPIILLPLGMANGLSLHQVEAILFHEIAHIYRFDYLVNLIQSLVEVLLFYHPVVWWLSAHIRSERENICDDIALRHTGNAINYAKALTSLQELNNQSPDIVLAFSNKKYRFMNRIRRLLGLPLIENNFIEGLISSLVLIVTVVSLTTHAGPALAQRVENNPTEKINPDKKITELPFVQDDGKKKEQQQKDIAELQKEKASKKEVDMKMKYSEMEDKMQKIKSQAEYEMQQLDNIPEVEKEKKIKQIQLEMEKKAKVLEAEMEKLQKQMLLEMEGKEFQMEKEMKMKEFQLQNEMQKKEYQMEAEFKKQNYEIELQMKKLEQEMNSKLEKIEEIRQSGKIEEANQMQQELEKKMEVQKMELDKKAKVMQLEMGKKEALKKARIADPQMIEEEASYNKLIEIFSKNLIADGLIKKGEATEFVLTTEDLTIGGKNQSKKIFKKYTQLLIDTQGEGVKDGKKFILNF